MMKKIFTIFFLLMYAVSGMGYVIATHFCADEISSISFKTNGKEKKNCGCDENDDICCKDEYKFFKIADEQKSITKIDFSPKMERSILYFAIQNSLKNFDSESYFLQNRFPPPKSNSLEIQNNSLLI